MAGGERPVKSTGRACGRSRVRSGRRTGEPGPFATRNRAADQIGGLGALDQRRVAVVIVWRGPHLTSVRVDAGAAREALGTKSANRATADTPRILRMPTSTVSPHAQFRESHDAGSRSARDRRQFGAHGNSHAQHRRVGLSSLPAEGGAVMRFDDEASDEPMSKRRRGYP